MYSYKYKKPEAIKKKTKVVFKSYQKPVSVIGKLLLSKKFFVLVLVLGFIFSSFTIINIFSTASQASLENSSENEFFKIYSVITNGRYENIKYKPNDKPNDKPSENSSEIKIEKKKETKIYVVKKGDTLGSIASQNGMSTKELLELNNMSNTDILQIGQNLTTSSN